MLGCGAMFVLIEEWSLAGDPHPASFEAWTPRRGPPLIYITNGHSFLRTSHWKKLKPVPDPQRDLTLSDISPALPEDVATTAPSNDETRQWLLSEPSLCPCHGLNLELEPHSSVTVIALSHLQTLSFHRLVFELPDIGNHVPIFHISVTFNGLFDSIRSSVHYRRTCAERSPSTETPVK
jgi:hypothetical protein